tara:strand:+ start:925 stop:3936 length:3012 start_codon:yes stop_codon:yes gene_type:complete
VPKELTEISNFMTGTITTPSERDIPDDSASYSLNIDPTTESGILQGLPNDDTIDYDAGGGSKVDITANAVAMATVNDDGDRDLVYYNASNTRFYKVPNVNAATEQASYLSSGNESSTGTPTMQVNNKEIHIGMGKGSANKPLWAGHIAHSQFGTAYSGLQLCDGALDNPSSFPDIYQFVEIGGYLYGIEWQGNHIYKFEDSSTGTFIKKSVAIFNSTQGICGATDGNIWLLDNDSGTLHLHKTDLNEMDSLFSVQINIAGSDVKTSDILVSGNYIWFSQYSDSSNTPAAIYNATEASFVAGASTVTVTARTPFNAYATGSGYNIATQLVAGHFVNSDSSAYVDVDFHAAKTCLLDIGNVRYVGWGVSLVNDTAGDSTDVYVQTGSSSRVAMHTVVISVKEDVAADAKILSSTDTTIWSLETTNDYLSDFTLKMFSITARQGGKIIISLGTAGATTTTVHTGTMLDRDGNGFNTNIDMDAGTTLQLSEAVVFQHDASNISGFSGNGSGQWLRGTAIGSLTQALEASVNLEFEKSSTTYGFSGSASTWVSGARTGFESSGVTYFYKVSFLYDGYQETPLSDDFIVPAGTLDGDGQAIDVTIQLKNLGTLNKRISHVNLYRASAPTASVFAKPDGFYRLVDSYELNTSFASVSATSPWSAYRQKTVRDINVNGASYEARTGLSEVITDITPRYALSTQLNNQHFITKCSHDIQDDVENYLFKSRAYNFDQFNWINDFLVLPTTPTAIASFNGRIYVFDDNNTYKIEPNNLYIEDTIEGIGCIGQNAVFANDYGMCFADKNNIYLHDGTRPTAIGEPILRGGTYSWESKNSAYTPMVTFDSFRKSFVIFFRISSSYYAWAFNMPRRRWDLAKFHASTEPKSSFINKNGEMVISNGTNLVTYLGHASTKRSWDWTSKKLHMRQNTGDKNFKNLRIVGSPSGTLGNTSTGVYVKVDDSDITEVSITGLTDINLGNTRGKQIQVFLAGQTGTVDAIGVIYRRYILLSKQG